MNGEIDRYITMPRVLDELVYHDLDRPKKKRHARKAQLWCE